MLETFYIIAGIASIIGIGIPVLSAFRRYVRRRGISWREAFQIADRMLVEIEQSGWRPEVVVGIGRSGAIWAGWFAGNLGSLPVAVVDKQYSFDELGRRVVFPVGAKIVATFLKREDLQSSHAHKLRVLLVEGASSNGTVLEEVRRQFKTILKDCDVRFALLYKNHVVTQHIDYVGRVETGPWLQKFPWHYRPVYQRRLDGS